MSARTTYLLLFLPALAMLALALYPFLQGVLTAFSRSQALLRHQQLHRLSELHRPVRG